MPNYAVHYTIEGSSRSSEFESIEDAEAFVTMLFATYGEEHVQNLVIEKIR